MLVLASSSFDIAECGGINGQCDTRPEWVERLVCAVHDF